MPGQNNGQRPQNMRDRIVSATFEILYRLPAILIKGASLGIIVGMLTSFTYWLYFFRDLDPASNFVALGILAEMCITLAKLAIHRDPDRSGLYSIKGWKLRSKSNKTISQVFTSAGRLLLAHKGIFIPTRAEFILLIAIILVASTPYYMPSLAKAITDHYEDSGYYRSFTPIYSGPDDGARIINIIAWSNAHFTDMYKGGGIWPIQPLGQYYLMASLSPPAITIRSADAQESLTTAYEWTMITKAGNCGENSILTLGLTNLAGIPVRRTYLQGEDHVFNEAFVAGRWIVIDPLNPFNKGYDIPPGFYEEGWKYHVSYVYARYPNGTIEDVTTRYTTAAYVDLLVEDENGKPVDNATVRVYSNNRQDLPPTALPIFTNLTGRTDARGAIKFRIGDGNYTITAVTDERIGKLKIALKANETLAMDLVVKPKGPINYLADMAKKNQFFNLLIGILGTVSTAYVLLVLAKLYDSRMLWAGLLLFLGVFLAYLLITFARLVLVF